MERHVGIAGLGGYFWVANVTMYEPVIFGNLTEIGGLASGEIIDDREAGWTVSENPMRQVRPDEAGATCDDDMAVGEGHSFSSELVVAAINCSAT